MIVKDCRSSPDPENSRCGHQQPYILFFQFLSISGLFRTTQENQDLSIRSRKISCNLGKIFFPIISKGKIFRAVRKNPYIVIITDESLSSNYVYSTILVITKIYMFLLLYFISVLLLIMRSQAASIAIAWTVTSTGAFCHCWSYMKHSDLWITCVVDIWYQHSLALWNIRIYLIFDFINVNHM